MSVQPEQRGPRSARGSAPAGASPLELRRRGYLGEGESGARSGLGVSGELHGLHS